MAVLCVLPARIASRRISRKPLQVIAGRPLIEWSWRAASRIEVFDAVWVATDSDEVAEYMTGVGATTVLTSSAHVSGTDRIGEAVATDTAHRFDTVVNFQPDEPFTDVSAISAAVQAVVERRVEIATVAAPIRSRAEWMSEAVVKVARAADGRALYFSRAPIPHLRDRNPSFGAEAEAERGMYLQHLGVYVYAREALERWVALPPSRLEVLEGLEQLRALEAGMDIQVVLAETGERGIDEPEDLARAERRLLALEEREKREDHA